MNIPTRRLILATILLLCVISLWRSLRNIKEAVSLKRLLVVAIKAAEIGGLEVVTVHNQSKYKIESKGQTKEGINDPVTAADYRSHCAMYRFLTEKLPRITVISEESSQDCDKLNIKIPETLSKVIEGYNIKDTYADIGDITIWIDPLDATKEFTENLLQYVSTMVCVAVKGQPIIGVIYKPFETKHNNNLFWTWNYQETHDASKNLKNLPKIKTNKTPVLIVSLSHAGQVKNSSKIAFGDNVTIISAAGAGYKFLEVAAGNATAYVHTTAIKKWDICSGTAILSALGGTVTQLYNQQPIDFGSNDDKILTKGLLATMSDHAWYSEKFLHNFPSDSH